MAVTRINNNQISDASAGNAYVGINAASKMQAYSITATKLANNLTYGSDLTVTGNLTVQGNTTTIDTTYTTIEDPILLLASNQTGSPAVDIGFIGERGTSQNIAFVWDESADEFVTAFTNDVETNTTITIASYSNFHTNDANVGGNLTVNGSTTYIGNITGNLSVTGNITGGNLLTPGLVGATGNVSGGNLVSAANVVSVGAEISGNITGGNLLTAGLVSATGNVSGGNLVSAANVVSVGAVVSGNITGGNLLTAGLVSATGEITSSANINGANVNASANLVSTGAAISGNVTGGNLLTAGVVSATGNVSGGNLTTAGQVTATGAITSSANVSGANVVASANLVSTGAAISGNVTGGNLLTAGVVSATGEITSSANINGANVNATSGVTAGTTVIATGNVTGGNLTTAGKVTATGNINSSANISGGNLAVTGAITSATIETTGNVLVGGNLTVQGNIQYVNVDDLRVEDPIIIMGTGPNGAPLTTDDGMDRGIYMEWYKTGLGNSWIGWENSSGNLIAAADVVFSANNVVNVNAYGTFQTGNIYAQSAVSTGNVTGGNLLTAGQVSATGNITGGNLSVGSGTISTTGNIDGGNLNATTNVTAAGGYFTSNVTIIGTLFSTSNIVANTSGTFYGNTVTGNGAIYGGVPGYTPLGSNVVIQFAGNANSYSQVNFQNINTGTSASTDYIATADDGDDSSYYIDVGINSSTFDDPINYPGFYPHDAYVHNHGGNLLLNPETVGTVIKMMVGGTDTTDVIATVSATGLSVTGTISATGNITGGNLLTGGLISATGAITSSANVNGANVNASANLVSAGAEVSGNITGGNLLTAGQVTATGNITGGNLVTPNLVSAATVTATGNVTGANVNTASMVLNGSNIDSSATRITVNSTSADVDFAVNGDTVANVFYVDAGTGTVSIGSSTQTTNAAFAMNATNSFLMPVGNTAQRPGVGVTGMLRFNSTLDAVEVYDADGWTTVGTPNFTVITDQQFDGDGVTVNFTLSEESTTNSTIVSINGIVQIPTIAYSVSSTTLTFTEAPQTGDIIDVRKLTTTTQVTSISNSPGNAIVQTNPTSAIVQITGDLNPTANVTFNLGSNTARWKDLYLSGSSMTLGNIVMKNTSGNTVAFYGPDGTTPATIDSTNVDTTTITNGTSSLSVIASGGNIRANVNGSTVGTFYSDGLSIPGIINSGANGVGNIGSSTTYFNTVFAKATSAQYADLAEVYAADAKYEPGTVLVFGGEAEVTMSTVTSDARIAGVVSTNPSYVMNATLNSEHTAVVALTGRVPTFVSGPVKKGDMMVSAGNGRAVACATPAMGTVIGKALENNLDKDSVIEIVVGRL